ncbi:MAG: HlyD family secretion protein [Candidatus Petromonas sp.]|nr:HlyD family secretion protein [Candidatus Petromonas sp.]
MTQRIFMILLILVIVFGGGFYAYKQLLPPEIEETQGPVYSTEKVVKGDIAVGVETTGRLDPSRHGGIRVPGDWRDRDSVQYVIEEFLVEEGDAVKKDQVIVRLDSSDLETKIEEKEEELEVKREQLSEMTGVSEENVEYLNPNKGITITSPIDGRIVGLDASEGKELELGHVIARVVNDSKFKVKIKLTINEFKKVKVGQKVVLSFPNFDGFYEGKITELNPNPVPNNQEEGFAKGFVHMGIVEADNPGLVQSGMKVTIGLKNENDDKVVNFFSIPGEVEGFVEEEKVINTAEEAIVTKVHVQNMESLKKGDEIITMASNDIQDMLEEKIEEIRELKTEIRELRNQLEQLEITSPMDGIVAGFNKEEGESARPGEWIGSIFNTSDMRMWAQVDDIDVINVKQDAPVKVTVDALPGEVFEGKVTHVSTSGEDVNGITKFMVNIEVKGGPNLKPGMQANAFIDAGSAENVLLVPLEAVFEEDGKTMVEILENGQPKVVPVKLGLMNDRVAEVKSGLEEGDMVITGSSADLLPSQHIGAKDKLLPDVKDKDDGNSENKNE